MKYKIQIISFILTTFIISGCAPALLVGTGAAVSAVHDRRTMGSFIEDQNIELKAQEAIYQDKELDKQSHISVTSYNGVVLMSGQTPTAEFRARAEDLVRGIEKVKTVHNELTIAAPGSANIGNTDTLVTGKVKTNLFKVKGHEDFDPSRVKVVTENGTVYLMGLLTPAEAEDVVSVVRQVNGVQRVVKMFEYIN